MFKAFSFFLVVCAAPLILPASAETSATPPGPPGPVTTDEDILSALNLDAPGMEKVKAAVQGNAGLPAIQQAYLDYRRQASPAKWRIMPTEEPAATENSDVDGDKICRHHIENYFYHFDPEEADMGRDFDWTFNPIPKNAPGFSNEFTWCAISRCQFWEKLSDAYWKTHDEKYAAEWVAELNDFAAKNRLDTDGQDGRVTMWRTLDAAVRMDEAWPYAYYHFLNSSSFTPEAQWLYLKMIRDHANCLNEGLSHADRSGNWVSLECFGLYTEGALFPELKDADSWRKTALDRIALEMNRLVPPDGMEAELTPSYHLVSLEGFLGPLKLAKLNGLSVPDGFKDKILAMYRALVTVMDQSGDDVPTNDCTTIVNAASLAKKGLEIGDDPVLEWAASGMTKGQPLPDSTMLPYAGFYTMRSGWKPDDMFLFFKAGPCGAIGHHHEDMLEVVMRAWGKTLLFDPGSYLYDQSEWRRFVINTPSHSTVIVDGNWQHRGASPIPVEGPMNNPWVTTPLFDYVAGTYDGGYQKNVYDPHRQFSPETWEGDLDHSITHTRRVLYLRPYYALVLDTLDGSGSHTFDALFQLDAPDAHIDQSSQAAFSDNESDAQIGLFPLNRDNLAVDVVKGQKDPMLGWYPEKHRPIPTVRFEKKQEAPALFATLLYPYRGSSPSVDGQPFEVTGNDAWGETLNTPTEKAEIAIVKTGTAEVFSFKSQLAGAVQMNAVGFLARQPSGGGGIFTGGWGISSYSDASAQFTTDAPANLALVAQGKTLLVYNGGDKPVALTLTRPFAQTATATPAAWTQISADGVVPGTAPTLFAPFISN
jgi:hypothetical protein